jgi:hypothetical protein
MPKILINEKDTTTPGTPGSYDNFAVLITGFAGNASGSAANGDPLVQADPNNAYEFKSAQAFKDTIGLVPPTLTKKTEEGQFSLKHYGNQMAYELLRSGFPIIYKSLGNIEKDYKNFSDVIKTITNEKMWEPFKDKASYDFRFVTHGLLSSTGMPPEKELELNNLKSQLTEIEAAVATLKKIKATAEELNAQPDVDDAFEINEYMESAYSQLITSDNPSSAFINPDTGVYYLNFKEAFDHIPVRAEALAQASSELANSYFTTDHINQINANIANLAQYVTVENPTNKTVYGRGDCVALIELDEQCYTTTKSDITDPIDLIISGINEMKDINSNNGKYCAMTVPSVTYQMPDNYADFNNNKTFPGAFHYLTCFINSIRLGFAEWYAAAGYTRGVSSYTIKSTAVKLGEIAINALEPRNINGAEDPKFACNVIANFRGSYYLWGNRTAHPLGKKGSLESGDLVASSFLNIRQLCTTIKKQLYVACRTFTFDPNSDALWVNFVNAIRPTLETMKADQGIRDYKILKVTTDTKATLKAKIRIIPIEAVEDFDLEVYLEDSFGETISVVNE